MEHIPSRLRVPCYILRKHEGDTTTELHRVCYGSDNTKQACALEEIMVVRNKAMFAWTEKVFGTNTPTLPNAHQFRQVISYVESMFTIDSMNPVT